MLIQIQVFRGFIYRVFHTKSFSSEEQLFIYQGFPGGSDGKECACRVGDLPLVPGEGNGYSLQYSCLEKSMDRGAQQATAPGVTERWTWLSECHFHLFRIILQYRIQLYNRNSQTEKVLILQQFFFLFLGYISLYGQLFVFQSHLK